MCTSTATGSTRPLSVVGRARLVAALRAGGLHLTGQREAVYEVIARCQGHVCVEHILEMATARRPALRMNKTTVYRTLDTLGKLGLVTSHQCGAGPAQYELASRGQHSHLICRECGAFEDLDAGVVAGLRVALRRRHGFEVELESYPILGRCAACGGGM